MITIVGSNPHSLYLFPCYPSAWPLFSSNPEFGVLIIPENLHIKINIICFWDCKYKTWRCIWRQISWTSSCIMIASWVIINIACRNSCVWYISQICKQCIIGCTGLVGKLGHSYNKWGLLPTLLCKCNCFPRILATPYLCCSRCKQRPIFIIILNVDFCASFKIYS